MYTCMHSCKSQKPGYTARNVTAVGLSPACPFVRILAILATAISDLQVVMVLKQKTAYFPS
ncbi:uncharacterized protein TRIVIDRAFT_91889 [Trichoderma virens Gv29-8]|uniref:Uncharacterized protein n=1 Tax=Hypocrea virens (strain Gv29-8 / FGSC 10586) TaxID=413071 RepID=G9MF53_HYPVG|nr:uncharacterized protein TRIVIDRAFT_91889 [Trichoderma virens Gv29-8]EHK27019.1 hypothetical protein TRIVIDRAFT_91889 [Trichoderma virens Gv29-8]